MPSLTITGIEFLVYRPTCSYCNYHYSICRI